MMPKSERTPFRVRLGIAVWASVSVCVCCSLQMCWNDPPANVIERDDCSANVIDLEPLQWDVDDRGVDAGLL